MVKFISLIFFLFVSTLISQGTNKSSLDEKSGKKILIGICNLDAFQDTSFAWWYNSEYENYSVDKETLNKINFDLNNLKIKIICGTWCSDSRREIPRFIKILDELKFPKDKFILICVDRKKKGTSDETKDLDITLVPTIIFYKEEKEIGRIIETPKESLEKDLIEILKDF